MTATLVLSAGHQLRDRAGALADAVVACEFGGDARRRLRHGPGARTRPRQAASTSVALLADAVDARSPAVFCDHVGWTKQMLRAQGARDEDLEQHLACLGEAVRRHMPQPVAQAALALIDSARAALPGMPPSAASFLETAHRLAPLAQQYLRHLLGGYRGAASRVAIDAARHGESVRDLYLHVFQPALREVGRLWQEQKVSVAQEHFCTAATQIVMAQLLPQGHGAERSGESVVVACVSGDQHDMGARMLADFFDMAGWDAYFCGANVPHDAVVAAVVDRGARLLAISATMGHHLHHVAELIATLRADPRCAGLRVMVGGRPFNLDPDLWRSLGADGSAADADAALALAQRWAAEARPGR